MLSIWLGDEPYLMNSEIEKQRSLLQYPAMNFVKGVLDASSYDACYTMAFFDDARKLFLYSDQKNLFLESLIDADDIPNDVAVILTGELDKRKSSYKKAEKKKLFRHFGRLNSREFDSFCRECLEGATVSKEAYAYLQGRMAYGKREDADLYTVKQWLGQIVSVPQLTKDVIDHLIPEYSEDNVFKLISYMANGDGKGYFKLLDRLLEGDPKGGISILSVLLRNFRLAYKAAVAGDAVEELGISPWQLKSVRGISEDKARESMRLLQESVNRIKGGCPQKPVISEVSCRILAVLKAD